MIETLHQVLTDEAARNSQSVNKSLAENSDVATPWFD
jgi:hypothetical protein